MRDPERLLGKPGSPEARLLASALDEPPPPDLLARTLQIVALPPPPGAPPAAIHGAAAGVAKSGGILGAAAIGAALGLLVVGGVELAQRSAAPPEPRVAISAPTSSVLVAPPPAPLPSATAPATPATPTLAPVTSGSRPLTLAAEIALLDEARSALRAGDRAGARAVLDRYAREIPRGQLGREAALLRAEIEADPTLDAGPTDR